MCYFLVILQSNMWNNVCLLLVTYLFPQYTISILFRVVLFSMTLSAWGTHGDQCFAWFTVRAAQEAEGLLPQEHFVSWIDLGLDFISSLTNIYIQFMRHVYSCCESDHGYRTQSGQRTLNLPCFHDFPDIIYS